jgi:hypothetical protein
MNQKKAKALRIIVRQLVKTGVLEGAYTRYGYVQHKVTVMKEGKTAKGHKEMQPQIEIHNSVTLDPKCPKAVYRRMKRDGIEAVLGHA